MAQERLGHDRWRFTLADQGPTADERAFLLPDLLAAGLDETLLDVYAAAAAAGPDPDDPEQLRVLLLRGDDPDGIVGLAAVLECRLLGSRYLPSARIGRGVDALHACVWFWDRTSTGADGHTGAGVLAHAVDRDMFVEAATRWLSRRYGTGAVVEPLGAPAHRHDVVTSFAPAAVLRLGEEDAPESPPLLAGLAGLTAAGGRVDVVRGPLPASLRPRLVRLMTAQVAAEPPVRRPVVAVAQALWSLPTTWHLVAVVDDEVVGFHSVLHCGRHLLSLASALDRRAGPAGTVPAASPAGLSLLLETARLARRLGCTDVPLGPAVESATSMAGTLRPARMRFVSRWPPIRVALRGLVPRSRIAPDQFQLSTAAVAAPVAPDVGGGH